MIHLDRASTTPLTEQIVQQIAGLIQAGQLPAGSRLPSIRKLAATLTVSSATVVAAYDRLTARGLIASRAASGFYVQARSGREAPSPTPPRRDSIDAVWLLRRMMEPHEGLLGAGSGFLPESWLEDMLSSRLLSRLARNGPRAYATCGTPEGYAPLRRQLALKLAQEGIPAHADQIITTAGATQAHDLVVRALFTAGDTVAVEDPGYYGVVAQLRAHGVRLIPIARRADGPDLNQLESACQSFRPKAFFTQTLMHNPTGSHTDVAVAARLVQLAERHDLLLVEDNVYGDLHPDSRAVPLAQIDRLRRTIVVGSFTKLLSPNIRVGYLAAPPAFVEPFIEHKLLSVLATSEFDERLVHELLVEGNYRKHIERVRQRLARQWPGVVQGLRMAGLDVAESDHANFFAWAALPEGIEEEPLVRDAAANGFLLTPGSVFFVKPNERPWLRFAVAAANDHKLFTYLKSRLDSLAARAWSPKIDPVHASRQ